MTTVQANISISLDGYVTGPNLVQHPGLGEGGEILHAWVDEPRAMDLAFGEERQIAGSIITSRTVFDETEGWKSENGFFRLPVFVVTHRPHDPVTRGDTTFSFVDGIHAAVQQASAAAGDKLVHIMGGASIIQQALAAGLVDELYVHIAPVILGAGTPLFEHLGGAPIPLERVEVVETARSTHIRYRIVH